MSRERRLRRAALKALIAALCLAAVVAAESLLSGSFSDTDWKVIATSLLLALAGATGTSGEAARPRAPLLGVTTEVASVLAFVFVATMLWGAVDSEAFAHVTGVVAIVAVEGAHVCFVRMSLRPGDAGAVRALAAAAVALAAISAVGGILPIAGALPGDWNSTTYGELLGIVLLGQLLCTVLAPLVRRLNASGERAVLEIPTERDRMAFELRSIAERLDAEPHLTRERDTLRRLARAIE